MSKCERMTDETPEKFEVLPISKQIHGQKILHINM